MNMRARTSSAASAGLASTSSNWVTRAVQALSDEVLAQRKARLARVTQLLDVDAQPAQAALEVRALMFIDRLLEEIDARLEHYEDAS